MNDKLILLESVLGRGHKSNRDYYQFTCPFHQGKNGPKLGISLGSGCWKCWVCPAKGSTVTNLIKKLNGSEQQVQHAKELWKEKSNYKYEPSTQLHLPKEYIPLWEPSGSFFFQKAKGYLRSRGVTESDIIKHRLGYCENGKYSDSIIFPSYDENGQLTFWSGRNFNIKRFCIPDNINKDEILFDENLVNWSETLIFVESKLDAISVKRNALPLYGKKINHIIKEKAIREGTPKIIFCLDGDALNDAMLQAEYFLNNGIPVSRTILPEGEDPSSIGYERVWKYINNAEPLNESQIWQFKMKNKLK